MSLRTPSLRTHPARAGGFTLPEVLVTMAIFAIVVGGFLALHLSGLKMQEVTRMKLGASDDARRSLSRLVDDVRGAGLVRVGQGTVESFVEAAPGTAQAGNAIQVYPLKSDTNRYVRYVLDLDDQRLKRVESDSDAVIVLAHAVTNDAPFAAEDHNGHLQTNAFNNRVIDLTLQFGQLMNPNMAVGPGNYYDSYQLRTKITRRALE
jgi:prepilin-type N-terminal cleavage/methylation domain-containing protein